MGSIVLVVIVDDIVISEDDLHGITALKHYLKHYLSNHFHMKNPGHLRYSFRIEVARSPQA